MLANRNKGNGGKQTQRTDHNGSAHIRKKSSKYFSTSAPYDGHIPRKLLQYFFLPAVSS